MAFPHVHVCDDPTYEARDRNMIAVLNWRVLTETDDIIWLQSWQSQVVSTRGKGTAELSFQTTHYIKFYLSSHDTIFKVKVERMVTIIFKLILILYSYQHVITINASIFQKEWQT